jgi:thymidylate kinase
MPDSAPAVLAIDGPPGSGKTSLLTRLALAHGDGCVFFTEPNARLASGTDAPAGTSTAEHTLWFLRHEQDKARHIAALADDPRTRVILLDRNYLGVLAFAYATDADNALPYHRVLRFHQRHIAPLLPDGLVTVILQVSTGVSLQRRGGAAERPVWQQWFSPGLLDRLRGFYADIAPGLCPTPPVVIDTDGLTPDDVASQVARLLPAPQPAGPVPSPEQDGHPGMHPSFASLYEQAGGLEALGHPVTGLYPYRGGQMQLCQLGAMARDPSGGTRLWDPAASLPETAARS